MFAELWSAKRAVRARGPQAHRKRPPNQPDQPAYGHLALQDAAGLFSRWAQENFFRYMQHYAIDLLSDWEPGTNRPVVNPPWRELERQSRSLKAG